MNLNLIFGGQFRPASGGQFQPALGGQFKSARGGQFHRFLQYSNDSATTTLINLINESNLIDDASVRSFSKGKLLITVIASNDTIYCFNSPIYKQNSINLEIYSECYTGWYIGALSNKNFYSFFKDLFEVRYLVKFP